MCLGKRDCWSVFRWWELFLDSGKRRGFAFRGNRWICQTRTAQSCAAPVRSWSGCRRREMRKRKCETRIDEEIRRGFYCAEAETQRYGEIRRGEEEAQINADFSID